MKNKWLLFARSREINCATTSCRSSSTACQKSSGATL